MALTLFNTRTRKEEPFVPLVNGVVSLYACGPTVYSPVHIGNMRTYLFEDTLRRVLTYNGYRVVHAMNITDVGHMTDDADDGDDKLEVAAKKSGREPLEIAREFEALFLDDAAQLGILKPDHLLRASDAIEAQIALVKELEGKGFVYQSDEAVYFDTSKVPDYGKLTGQKLDDKRAGARDEVVLDPHKRNPSDFVLWFFLTGRHANHILHWPSPWGVGFPGWHLECSAIARALVGQPFDIHAGGVDLIGTHHSNEIAQSEAAYGVPLATYWMHGEHLLMNEKMSKSLGNVITVRDLNARGFDPLSFRYLTLLTHYRQKLGFSYEALTQADRAYQHLIYALYLLMKQTQKVGTVLEAWRERFLEAINDDLGMPQALAITWELIKERSVSPEDRYATVIDFDRVFGLDLVGHVATLAPQMSDAVRESIAEREAARQAGDFERADLLRDEIGSQGYDLDDTDDGPVIRRRRAAS